MRLLRDYRSQLTIIAVSIAVILVSACFGPSRRSPVPYPLRPTIDYINPYSTKAGGPDLKLVIRGKYFLRPVSVQWNGHLVESRYIDERTVEATIPAKDIALPGTFDVSVRNSNGASRVKKYVLTP